MTPCPRCSGFLTTEDDYIGRDLVCVNCGYREPLDNYDLEAKPQGPTHGRTYTGRLRGMTTAQRRPRQ